MGEGYVGVMRDVYIDTVYISRRVGWLGWRGSALNTCGRNSILDAFIG